ncbi:hypothetical protein K438DRAFT_1774705 [Mycena galopus ATCC 62051]|nr:hypothetical protein K438DRAFT_1774705 [Mycena galopus ATCC 62051]
MPPKGHVKGRICNCPLRASAHRVEDEDAHRQEFETFLRNRELANETQNLDTNDMAALAEGVARVSISQGHPSSSISSQAPAPHMVLAAAETSVRAVLSEALNAHTKQPTRQAQTTRVLEVLSSKIQTAIATLQSADSAPEAIDSLWEKVDHVKGEIALAANSLKPLKETPEKSRIHRYTSRRQATSILRLR